MRDKVLVIDGDNLCHRAYHKFSDLSNPRGESSALPFGFFYILSSLVKRFKADRVYIAFDSGSSPHRRALLPEYRVRERSETFDAEIFSRQKEEIRHLCQNINIHTIWTPSSEADDLIYMVIKRKLKDDYVTIVSSDKDFIQLVGGTVTVYNPYKNVTITELNIEKTLGYTAKQHLQYLILRGDKSDKVPGVRGMGDVRIKTFLEEYETIEEYLESTPTHPWSKYPIAEVYALNNQLINLRLFYLRYKRKEPLPLQLASGYSQQHITTFTRLYNINKVDFTIFKNLR